MICAWERGAGWGLAAQGLGGPLQTRIVLSGRAATGYRFVCLPLCLRLCQSVNIQFWETC